MSKYVPLFQIDNKYLYREQNLIVIQVPVLFICKNEDGQRFMVTLANFESDSYIICPICKGTLHEIIRGNVEIRRVYANSEKILLVQAGMSLSEDKISIVPYDKIENFLPDGCLLGVPSI